MQAIQTRPSEAFASDAGTARGFHAALIVDDHPLFCDALAMTLRAVAGIDRIEAVGSLAAALDRLERHGPVDLLVLDLNLPDVSGLDGLVALRAAARGACLLVVSSVTEHRIIAAALAAGAAGFVPKHAPRDVLRRALERVAAGDTFLPDGVAALDEGPEPPGARDEAIRRLSGLSPQQARILALICAGKLNKQIAWDLGIAEATVKAHVTAIMRKLGVQSRTQAVLLARDLSFERVLRD